jgi:hypothetical protein
LLALHLGNLISECRQLHYAPVNIRDSEELKNSPKSSDITSCDTDGFPRVIKVWRHCICALLAHGPMQPWNGWARSASLDTAVLVRDVSQTECSKPTTAMFLFLWGPEVEHSGHALHEGPVANIAKVCSAPHSFQQSSMKRRQPIIFTSKLLQLHHSTHRCSLISTDTGYLSVRLILWSCRADG